MARVSDKIVGLEELLRRRADARDAGRRLVHCHGCFDIVHPGHIRHLRYAKSQGDLLLVSITGDAAIRKGTGRPLIPEELRAENLAELDCVDLVHIEPSPTAAGLLEWVRPDLYIKGREYEFSDDPRFRAEREAVERHGGRVVFSSGDVVFSSSALINALTAETEEGLDPSHRRLTELTTHPELSAEALARALGAIRGKRVLVAGEVIRDTYVFCDQPGVAGESPMLTLRPIERRGFDGGAAVIARHAAALGARPILLTALPEGAAAEALRARLAAEGIDVRSVPTTAALAEKQRMLVGPTKVVKLDLVEQISLDAASRDDLIAAAEAALEHAGGVDAAIVADFGLGLLTPAVLARLTRALRPHCGLLAGDVSGRRSALRQMAGMDLLTPSESEVRDAYGSFGESLPAVAWRLLSETGAAAAIITMGADGLVAFDRLPGADTAQGHESRLRGEHVPSFSPHAVDPLGCGDALLATASLARATGAGLLAASFLGAAAAAVQARTLGNPAIDPARLRRELARVESAHLSLARAEIPQPIPLTADRIPLVRTPVRVPIEPAGPSAFGRGTLPATPEGHGEARQAS